MSPFQRQLAKEARYDVITAMVWLVVFFGCMLLLPIWMFWFYFLPMAAFWLRYLFVRDARDEALLRADGLFDAGHRPARCYRSEAGICITDGADQRWVLGNELDPLLQLTHVIGDE